MLLGLILAASALAAGPAPPCRAIAPAVAGWNAPGTRIPLRASLTYDLPPFAEAPVLRAWRTWRLVVAGEDAADAEARIVITMAPLDGPGRVLAQTYYPADTPDRRGRVLMDDAEDWDKLDLYSVVLHEIGHALGLGHSSVRSAVMWERYRPTSGLTIDDVVSVAALYELRPVPVVIGEL